MARYQKTGYYYMIQGIKYTEYIDTTTNEKVYMESI